MNRNLFEFIKLAVYKILIAPFQYGKKNDYDAARYWEDRFTKYGATLKAVGVESLSPEENAKMYKADEEVFISVLKEQAVDVKSARILEIGCGTGFYTGIMRSMGCGHLTGIDITDAFFKQLQSVFPDYQFIKQDVSERPIVETFNLILCIDVIIHIVNDAKMKKAITHLSDALEGNGVLLIAPLTKSPKKELFHVRKWSENEILSLAPHLKIERSIPFRSGYLCVMKKTDTL